MQEMTNFCGVGEMFWKGDQSPAIPFSNCELWGGTGTKRGENNDAYYQGRKILFLAKELSRAHTIVYLHHCLKCLKDFGLVMFMVSWYTDNQS